MRFAALALAALLFLNCASVPRDPNPIDHTNRILVHHENDTFYRTTIYLLNGNMRRRLFSCDGLMRCQHWISENQSDEVLQKGYIELGWRLDKGQSVFVPGRPLHGRGQLSVWEKNAVVIIRIGPLNTWIYPGEQPKQADE